MHFVYEGYLRASYNMWMTFILESSSWWGEMMKWPTTSFKKANIPSSFTEVVKHFGCEIMLNRYVKNIFSMLIDSFIYKNALPVVSGVLLSPWKIGIQSTFVSYHRRIEGLSWRIVQLSSTWHKHSKLECKLTRWIYTWMYTTLGSWTIKYKKQTYKKYRVYRIQIHHPSL